MWSKFYQQNKKLLSKLTFYIYDHRWYILATSAVRYSTWPRRKTLATKIFSGKLLVVKIPVFVCLLGKRFFRVLYVIDRNTTCTQQKEEKSLSQNACHLATANVFMSSWRCVGSLTKQNALLSRRTKTLYRCTKVTRSYLLQRGKEASLLSACAPKPAEFLSLYQLYLHSAQPAPLPLPLLHQLTFIVL